MRTSNVGTCLSCGPGKLIYSKQLCKKCYGRAWLQGIQHNYPACGAVPVPYRQGATCLHPAALPSTIDLTALVPRIRKPWGAPQHPQWQKTVAYEQRRAAEWLANRANQRAA